MTTQTQLEPVGLVTEGGAAVPLLAVKVEAEIRAGAARVSLAQRYRNDEAAPIEAVYVFPLAARSAVNAFDVRVGERLLNGEIKPRDEAFAAYDDALEAGFGAYLLDQERPNVFTASVGNLPPGAEVTVQLGYVSELDWEGDTIRFVLPTTISPRYVSEDELARRQVGQPEHERVTPPVAAEVPYRLELQVTAAVGEQLRSAASPSHPIAVEWDGTTAIVRLAQESAALDRDFVLLLTPHDAAEPGAIVEREPDGSATAMVTILPDFDAPRTPQEVVFVVDCSGSMGGDSIDQARRALQLCLRQLDEGDRFNLVRFGSQHTALWPEPRVYGPETFAQADAYAAKMDADLGGTEILRPLQRVLSAPAGDGVRQVLLLTDGEVSNDDAVIALAREQAGHARIFTFGIGAGSNEHLCRGVAEASRGAAEFIYPGERIEPKVLRQFNRLALPQAGSVKVTGGAPVPDPLPPLFDGERVTFFMRLTGDQPAELVVTADGGHRWAVPLPAAVEGELLGTLCARREIESLEQDSPAHAGSQQAGRRRERNARRLRELALKYRLMSSETSFVVTEERAEGERVEQPAALRRVATMLTHGWGESNRPGMVMARSAAVPAAAPPAGVGRRVARAAGQFLGQMLNDRLSLSADASLAGPVQPRETHSSFADMAEDAYQLNLAQQRPADRTPEPWQGILLLQQADGSFPLDAPLDELLGRSLPELRSLARALGEQGEAVLATVLALALLDKLASDQRPLWQGAARKARRWLDGLAGLDQMRIEGVPVAEWAGRLVAGLTR